MSLWLVRAGSHGSQEQVALDNKVVTIAWNRFSDLSGVKSKEELGRLYNELYPDEKKLTAAIAIGQVWRFVHDIQIGDLVVLPLKNQPIVAIGKVKGEYRYKVISDNVKHIHDVDWLKMVPRTAIDQDLLYSFGALMTVCEISRNDAEARIQKLIGLKDFGQIKHEEAPVSDEKIDVGSMAKDEIRKYIDRKFKGHDLPRLVEAILKAQGYFTETASPGPDGGIDILAAAGVLGFDTPRICVQVKSQDSPVDVKVLRELQGVMQKSGADRGLLVSWGGFNTKAVQEGRDAFFDIRLWDSDDLLNAIFQNYDKFGDEIKAEIPLKRIWALVLEENLD